MWVGTVTQIIVNRGAKCSPKTQARDLKGPLTLSTDHPPPHQKDDMDSILLTETGDTKGPGRGTQVGESHVTDTTRQHNQFLYFAAALFFFGLNGTSTKQTIHSLPLKWPVWLRL